MRAVLLVAVLAGCTGNIELPPAQLSPTDPTGPAADPFAFVCAANPEPSVSAVSKLNRTQYLNTLSDLMLRAFDAPTVASLMGAPTVAAGIAQLPADGQGGHTIVFDTQDQGLSPLLSSAQFETTRAIATWITSDSTRLQKFVRAFAGAGSSADCATVTASACVDAFIKGFGLRTLRRPLDAADDDAAFYRETYDTEGGYRAVIINLMLAPGFLFQTEFKGTAIDDRDELTQLSPYEIASRLSYYLTNSMPDEALLAAAASGFTGTGNTVAEQMARLEAGPGAHGQLRNFYRQWLRLERIPGLSNTLLLPSLALQYPDQPGSALPANTDLVALRLNAFQELLDLTDYYTFSADKGSLADLITSDVSFAKTADLTKIYGVPSWSGTRADGSYDATQLVKFPEGERAGLFARAAFLFSGQTNSNLIIRGARIRTEYLCDPLVPPANVSVPDQAKAAVPAEATERQTLETDTQTVGTVCAGCHKPSINPLGFPLEEYDSLGRHRTQQQLIVAATGAYSGWAAVDATSQPRVDSAIDPATVTGAAGYAPILAHSGKLSACFTRNYFRYFVGRQEDDVQDGCMLEGMRQALIDPAKGSLQSLIQKVPTMTPFTQRKVSGI